jgi:twitching motility protein PilT
VILVGEMRDLETISTALTAAETWSPGSVHAAHTSMRRKQSCVSFRSFPSHQQKSVRIQLAGILKAVISMRLVRAAKGQAGACRGSNGLDGADPRLHCQRRQDFADS